MWADEEPAAPAHAPPADLPDLEAGEEGVKGVPREMQAALGLAEDPEGFAVDVRSGRRASKAHRVPSSCLSIFKSCCLSLGDIFFCRKAPLLPLAARGGSGGSAAPVQQGMPAGIELRQPPPGLRFAVGSREFHLKFSILPTPGSGHCLYFTVSFTLWGTFDHHDRVRKAVAAHMKNNAGRFLQSTGVLRAGCEMGPELWMLKHKARELGVPMEMLSGHYRRSVECFRAYCDHVASSSEYATNLELQAASEVYAFGCILWNRDTLALRDCFQQEYAQRFGRQLLAAYTPATGGREPHYEVVLPRGGRAPLQLADMACPDVPLEAALVGASNRDAWDRSGHPADLSVLDVSPATDINPILRAMALSLHTQRFLRGRDIREVMARHGTHFADSPVVAALALMGEEENRGHLEALRELLGKAAFLYTPEIFQLARPLRSEQETAWRMLGAVGQEGVGRGLQEAGGILMQAQVALQELGAALQADPEAATVEVEEAVESLYSILLVLV